MTEFVRSPNPSAHLVMVLGVIDIPFGASALAKLTYPANIKIVTDESVLRLMTFL